MLAAIGVTAADVFIKLFLRVIHMRFQKITGLQNCGSLGNSPRSFFWQNYCLETISSSLDEFYRRYF